MAASSPLAPELKVCIPYYSVHPHRKSVNCSCLTDFQLNSVFTQPITKHFLNLGRGPHLESPNFIDTCAAPPRKVGGLAWLCCLLGPCSESIWLTMQWFEIYGNIEQKASAWTCYFQLPSLLQCLGTLPHSGTPFLFVTQGFP